MRLFSRCSSPSPRAPRPPRPSLSSASKAKRAERGRRRGRGSRRAAQRARPRATALARPSRRRLPRPPTSRATRAMRRAPPTTKSPERRGARRHKRDRRALRSRSEAPPGRAPLGRTLKTVPPRVPCSPQLVIKMTPSPLSRPESTLRLRRARSTPRRLDAVARKAPSGSGSMSRRTAA
jgi:hypothetical protein